MTTVDCVWAGAVSWGHTDGILRIRNKRDAPAVNFIHRSNAEQVNITLNQRHVAVPEFFSREIFLWKNRLMTRLWVLRIKHVPFLRSWENQLQWGTPKWDMRPVPFIHTLKLCTLKSVVGMAALAVRTL